MSNIIENLIYQFSRLPGVGKRSARRIIINILKNKETILIPLINSLSEADKFVKKCIICGNLDIGEKCNICLDDKRDHSVICVVESISDLWALERSNFFKGKYHVLGGNLSAIGNNTPQTINLDNLLKRAEEEAIKEIIIATNATIEGQTTAFYITEKLDNLNVKITRLAYGMPIGSELDYLDEGTLSAAYESRKKFTS